MENVLIVGLLTTRKAEMIITERLERRRRKKGGLRGERGMKMVTKIALPEMTSLKKDNRTSCSPFHQSLKNKKPYHPQRRPGQSQGIIEYIRRCEQKTWLRTHCQQRMEQGKLESRWLPKTGLSGGGGAGPHSAS